MKKDEAVDCVVCASGLTVSKDRTTPYPEANGISREQMMWFAGRTNAADDVCEAVCCPDEGAEDVTTAGPDTTEKPDEEGACVVCTGGLTVDEDTTIPFEEANGAKCGEMLDRG